MNYLTKIDGLIRYMEKGVHHYYHIFSLWLEGKHATKHGCKNCAWCSKDGDYCTLYPMSAPLYKKEWLK